MHFLEMYACPWALCIYSYVLTYQVRHFEVHNARAPVLQLLLVATAEILMCKHAICCKQQIEVNI